MPCKDAALVGSARPPPPAHLAGRARNPPPLLVPRCSPSLPPAIGPPPSRVPRQAQFLSMNPALPPASRSAQEPKLPSLPSGPAQRAPSCHRGIIAPILSSKHTCGRRVRRRVRGHRRLGSWNWMVRRGRGLRVRRLWDGCIQHRHDVQVEAAFGVSGCSLVCCGSGNWRGVGTRRAGCDVLVTCSALWPSASLRQRPCTHVGRGRGAGGRPHAR